MLYTSQDINGTLVPATGFIAVPFVRRQKDPFRLIALAHGTIGVFRGCAPSSSSKLFDYNSWTPLLLAGYAVVATEYAGLGNDMIKHQYIASAAYANDVYWSVAAAHEAFPNDLTREWVSIGHSQGGDVVYKLSEHKLVQDNSSGYLGVSRWLRSPRSRIRLFTVPLRMATLILTKRGTKKFLWRWVHLSLVFRWSSPATLLLSWLPPCARESNWPR